MNTIRYFSLIGLLFIFHSISAQEMKDKVVEVVKPYVPVVSDASKINVLPEFNDTAIITPTFNYQVVPSVLSTDYQLNKINPAKMVTPPLTKLYKNYLKLGFGNYSTPLLEIYMNSQRSKKHTVGLFGHHQSSGGKIKLDNGQKVFAGYSDNDAVLFGKRFFKKSMLYGDFGIKSNTVYQYGYRTNLAEMDTVLEKGDIRQKCFTASFLAGFKSSHNDSSDLSYDFKVGYSYSQNRFSQGEGDLWIAADGYKLYKNNLVGLKGNLIVLKPNSKFDTLRYSNSLFGLQPYIILTTPEYRLQGGVNLLFENQLNKTSFYFYPDAEFTINIAKDVLAGFVGIKAFLKEHSYSSMFAENPFVRPDLFIRNTNISSTFYAGFNGSLGSKASFIAKGGLTKTKHDYFFINDTLNKLQNQFTVVYDNTQTVNFSVQANYDFSQSLAFEMKGNYYMYSLEKENKAWHRPDMDLTISTKYNLRNKILVNLDIFYLGKRYIKLFEGGTNTKELSGVVDVNLGLEYRYTKILSGWIRLNNLAASKYYLWNYYPSQGFNFMFGITYSL